MVNKLLIVRVDNFTVQKLNLQIGDNIIGRGAATGHVDNPIAEQAVTITLAPTGEMSMIPMLACYMKSTGSNRWQSLEVGSSVVIRPGDICSLIPDRSWFKITSTDYSAMDEDKDINGKRKSENNSGEEPSNKKRRSQSSVETVYSQSRDVLDTWDDDERVDDNCNSNNTNDVPDDGSAAKKTQSFNARNQSCSVEVILSDSNNTGNTALSATAKVSTPSKGKTTAAESTDLTDTKETASNKNRDDAEKKIKWDCGRHFSDQTEQQTVETNENQNLDEASASTVNNSSATDEAAMPTEEPPRNKCTYGSQCYRRNSDHRARFSHPGDPDYDIPDSRPECPYGVRCYRKNPQHKRDFKHTKNRRSRAQTPVRVRDPDEASGTEYSSAEESVDESEYEPSLYDGTSDDYNSEYDDRSDLDGTSDLDDK